MIVECIMAQSSLGLVAANVLIVMLVSLFILVHCICILYFNNSFLISICL